MKVRNVSHMINFTPVHMCCYPAIKERQTHSGPPETDKNEDILIPLNLTPDNQTVLLNQG